MDVIINNPAPAAPQFVAPQYAPQYAPVQGYGYAPYGPFPSRDRDGPGFGGVLLLLVGGVLLARFLRMRRFARRMRFARPGGPTGPGNAPAGEADRDEGAERFADLWRRGREGFFSDRALDIARERLAKGEITPEEYETIRAALERPA